MAEMRKRTSMSVLEMGRMLGLGKRSHTGSLRRITSKPFLSATP